MTYPDAETRRPTSHRHRRYIHEISHTHLLAKARFTILSFSTVDEGRGFCIETVQAVGGLVDESVVLGDKLPADLRGDDAGASRIGRVRLSAHYTIQMRCEQCDRSGRADERDDDARESERA